MSRTPAITVTPPCNNCHAPKPANPAGDWLEDAGFTTGQPVTITAKKGKLIVEIAR
ncbi:type I addiction module toxin, SymE family [Gilliamella sp. M0320]|uniref:SymE family type I addiction module toxin n=1 Tax=Gilliamella sp. M0320 TaxID=2750965 RepID=UPI0018DC1DEE|nr:type I addiction module toxin, SymE family [Gilliamella sp. M0320]